MHLLLIEDDLDLGAGLTQALRAEGMTCEWVRSLRDGASFAAARDFDACLLDLTLPDGRGLDLMRAWRAGGRAIPVIVITASAALADRLAGLDGGADDVLIKPFAIPELVARLRAVTRRAAQQVSSLWTLGELAIDEQQRRVWLDGIEITLTPRELGLLLILARAGGRVVPKHRLSHLLNPLGEPLDFAAIEVHVHHLRRKLGEARIRTVRGLGYRLPLGDERAPTH